MSATSPLAIVQDEAYLRHDAGPFHPERPDRLRAVAAALAACAPADRVIALPPREAGSEDLHLLHPPAYVDLVVRECAAASAPVHLSTGDTVIGRESERIARLAVGGVLAACDAIMAGKAARAFCAVRPPGHHALPARGMGFCVYNSLALGARHLQTRHRVERVLIADFDYHHGNGTEAAFYEDGSVFVFSCHDLFAYPGTGHPGRQGEGSGAGRNLNVPLPPGSGDEAMLQALERQLTPAARAFGPEFLLVSAGFDGHRSDPLGAFTCTEEGYGDAARLLRELADDLCGGRALALLEGGYDLEALGASVGAFCAEWSRP